MTEGDYNYMEESSYLHTNYPGKTRIVVKSVNAMIEVGKRSGPLP
jgi:hypothetical protein